jgi:hypothetical protein
LNATFEQMMRTGPRQSGAIGQVRLFGPAVQLVTHPTQ